MMPPPPGAGHRPVPRYETKRSSSTCCCKCVCCFFIFFFLLVLLIGGFSLYVYLVCKPKIPTYSVDGLDVKNFDLLPDFSLKTVFFVRVRADNPNTHIGFTYGKNSSVAVTYKDSVLCSGELPHFHQPPENVTVMAIKMTGISEFGSGLQEAFQENKDTGRIPLLVRVKEPVKVALGKFSFHEFVVYVNCSLVVDNLQPGKPVGIVKSKYTFAVSF